MTTQFNRSETYLNRTLYTLLVYLAEKARYILDYTQPNRQKLLSLSQYRHAIISFSNVVSPERSAPFPSSAVENSSTRQSRLRVADRAHQRDLISGLPSSSPLLRARTLVDRPGMRDLWQNLLCTFSTPFSSRCFFTGEGAFPLSNLSKKNGLPAHVNNKKRLGEVATTS